MTKLDAIGTTGGKVTVESTIPEHGTRKAVKPIAPVKMRQSWCCRSCLESGEVTFRLIDGCGKSWAMIEEAHKTADPECEKNHGSAGVYVKQAMVA